MLGVRSRTALAEVAKGPGRWVTGPGTPAPQAVQENVVYEQPLNERVRTFLRLECLFTGAYAHVDGPSPWESRMVLGHLLDILAICGRTDLKTEVMKELERQTALLEALRHNPEVDRGRLVALLEQLETLVDGLHAMTGQPGQSLRGQELLNAVRQRSSIPGGTCHFDLPGLHHWLHRPAEERSAQLRRWLEQLEPVRQAIALLLRLIRQSARPVRQQASGGFFQQALDPNAPTQLLRVTLPAASPCYAEISAGRHRFTVRFLRPGPEGRAVQAEEDVDFLLACCTL